MTVVVSERLLDFADGEGGIDSILHLVGEIDATDELGCIVVYAIDISRTPRSQPGMEMMKSLIEQECLAELERARAAHAS